MDSSRVTAEDVARHAGVSRSTVSRAFSPGRSVQKKTRNRILKAAKELGYEPNALAQALISKQSHIIGILMGELSNPFHAVLHQSLSHQLQTQGFIPISAQMGPEDGIQGVITMFRQYQVGVVIMTSMQVSPDMVAACQEAGLTVILLNRVDRNGTTSSVCADVGQGGRLATQQLIARGCRKIGIAEGAQGSWTSSARLEGHLSGLRALEQAPLFIEKGGYTYNHGSALADQIVDENRDLPDGMLCPNDLFAIGFMDRLKSLKGMRFPDDMAVVGFDDIPMASWDSYALTTVRLPVQTMVERTVEMIDRRLTRKEDSEETIWIPCRIIERLSA